MADLSPMMQQYMQIKKENPETVLFFRLGDFYEMFFDDAMLASRELELTLTGRDCGQEERAPMCGVPYHSCEGYIARLVEKGYKVAVCEQTEDPAKAKGLVKREVIRVITPGTVTEKVMLDESYNNYLACLYREDNEVSLCFTDTSTGQLNQTFFSEKKPNERIKNELSRYMPREVILNSCAANDEICTFIKTALNCCFEIMPDTHFEKRASRELVLTHFNVKNPDELRLENDASLCSVAGTLKYLFDTQMTDLQNINTVNTYSNANFMALDFSARRNLELFETMRAKERRGSLLWVLDKTKTSMGRRMLRSWLEQPLVNPAQITRRLNAVDEIFSDNVLAEEISDALSGVYDLERLMTRVVYSSANAPDLLSVAASLERLPQIKQLLCTAKCKMLREIYADIDLLQDVKELIDASIETEKTPSILREGGIIKKSYNEELASLLDDRDGGHETIAAIESRERERTGIKNLRVSYNRVFGYYIEVTNSFKNLVPDDYIRKQTTTNAERYITEELKVLEKRILGAKERSIQLEYELFCDVRSQVGAALYRVQKTAAALARLDVLVCFAYDAVHNNYVCPDISSNGKIIIKNGRHPVVESVLLAPFVPNDVNLDLNDNRCAIITGPNMAGKSTFMRQVALITIMAQIGSFVPAESAQIGVVDAVFTRVGASDDLFSGQSTFMVEMNEVASIIKNATKNSLLILDEIGRGTSTYDGMSIARAVLEYIVSKKLGAKTLFATHYHELTELESVIPGVKNYNISVKKRGDEITFLRRIVHGPAESSYGVEVALLAGVPKPVVERAKVILSELESENSGETVRGAAPLNEQAQLTFASSAENPLAERIKNLDVNTLTPIEAMNELFELVKIAKGL